MSQAQLLSISLSALKPGDDYPGGSINSRSYSTDEIDQMANSIEQFGLLQSLIVIDHKGSHFVAAGNRRLKALQALRAKKKIAADYAVPVLIRQSESGAEGLAASIEENINRRSLHPVEEFMAFAALSERGIEIPTIAKMYGRKEREVLAAIKIGQLSPKIRTEWLKGSLRAEAAQAFIWGKDHKHQDATYDKLRKSGGWQLNDPRRIRTLLVGDGHESNRLLTFVGRKEYAAAGGSIVEDLLGKEDAVSNFDLLTKLADAKIAAEVDGLKKSGWGWVEAATDQNRNLRYGAKVPGGKRASAKDKAKSGCIVSVDNDGALEVFYGVLRAGQRAPAKKKTAAAIAAGPGVSQALAQRMSEWATEAIADVLRLDRDTAMAAACAAAASNSSQITISQRGLTTRKGRDADTYEFGEQLRAHLASDQVVLMSHVAAMVAESLNFQVFKPTPDLLRTGDAGALCAALDRNAVFKSLHAVFVKNASDYFISASKDVCLEAVAEALGADHAKKLASASKKDVAAFCVEHIPARGWLPDQMSTMNPRPRAPAARAETKKPAKAKPTKAKKK